MKENEARHAAMKQRRNHAALVFPVLLCCHIPRLHVLEVTPQVKAPAAVATRAIKGRV